MVVPVPGLEGKPAPAERDTFGGEEDGVLLAAPNHRFSLAFYALAAGSWHAIEIPDGEDAGTWWVCQPVKVLHRPGLNGVRAKRAGDRPGDHLIVARERVQRDGGIWVDHSAEYPFLGQLACRHPISGQEGHYHHELPSRVIPGTDREPPTVVVDRVGWARLLLRIQRALGIQPSPRVLESRGSAAERAVARIQLAAPGEIAPAARPVLAAAAEDRKATTGRAKVAERTGPKRPRSTRAA